MAASFAAANAADLGWVCLAPAAFMALYYYLVLPQVRVCMCVWGGEGLYGCVHVCACGGAACACVRGAVGRSQ